MREIEDQERAFHALAHSSRRQVLLVLHARGDRMCASEIATRFSCSWPTISRHLKVLQEAGLVTVEQVGRERWYQLESDHLTAVVGGWADHFKVG